MTGAENVSTDEELLTTNQQFVIMWLKNFSWWCLRRLSTNQSAMLGENDMTGKQNEIDKTIRKGTAHGNKKVVFAKEIGRQYR